MNLLNIIYPNICGMCGKIIKSSICPKCKLKINKIACVNKINYNDKYFNSHIYFFKYEGIIREKILQFKFNENAYLYKFFSEIILNNCFLLGDYDIILSVPIHKKRKMTRGYNQSDLIVKYIAKKLNIEYCKDVLVKRIHNVPQSTLTKTERTKNVLGIYNVKNAQKIADKNILLVDDIYTTGSTLNECAKVLKQNGANCIEVLTIAKD